MFTEDIAKTGSAATAATARPGTRASTVKLVKTLWTVEVKQCYLTQKHESLLVNVTIPWVKVGDG